MRMSPGNLQEKATRLDSEVNAIFGVSDLDLGGRSSTLKSM